MSNKFRCPSCRSAFPSEEAHAGQKMTCPVCGQTLVVRKPSSAPIKPFPQGTPPSNIPQAIPVAGVAPTDAGQDLEEAPRAGPAVPE